MTPRHHISEAAVVSGLGCCTVTGDLPTRLYQQVCAKVPVASYLRPVSYTHLDVYKRQDRHAVSVPNGR